MKTTQSEGFALTDIQLAHSLNRLEQQFNTVIDRMSSDTYPRQSPDWSNTVEVADFMSHEGASLPPPTWAMYGRRVYNSCSNESVFTVACGAWGRRTAAGGDEKRARANSLLARYQDKFIFNGIKSLEEVDEILSKFPTELAQAIA